MCGSDGYSRVSEYKKLCKRLTILFHSILTTMSAGSVNEIQTTRRTLKEGTSTHYRPNVSGDTQQTGKQQDHDLLSRMSNRGFYTEFDDNREHSRYLPASSSWRTTVRRIALLSVVIIQNHTMYESVLNIFDHKEPTEGIRQRCR